MEEKYLDGEVDKETYHKWLKKYRTNIAALQHDIDRGESVSKNNPIEKLNTVLPATKNLRGLYQIASLEDQHELVKAVFKGKLTYSDGVFRTPAIAPMFEDNALRIKKRVAHL